MTGQSSLPRRELLSLVGAASTVGVSGLTGVSAQQAGPELVVTYTTASCPPTAICRGSDTACAGEVFETAVTVSNTGDATSTGIEVTVTRPGPDWTFKSTSGEFSTLEPGEQQTETVTWGVPSDARGEYTGSAIAEDNQGSTARDSTTITVEECDNDGCSRDLRSIVCGETKRGCIDQEDPSVHLDPGGTRYWEPVSFTLEEACEITIDMRSDAGDTYLKLFEVVEESSGDPARNSTSPATGRFEIVEEPSGDEEPVLELVAEDDNGGQGTNSRITITLSPGRYQINATHPLEQQGIPMPYELTVKCECNVTSDPVCCCLDDVTISEGEPAELCFYLREVDVDFQSCEVHIPVPDEFVEIVNIRLNDALSGQADIRNQGSEAVISVTDVNDQFAGDQSEIWIACCELACRGEGEAIARPQIQTLTNNAGESIRFNVNPARITVERCVGDPDGVCGCLDDVTIREGEGGELCFYLRDVDVGLASCEALVSVPEEVTITDLEVNDAFSSDHSERREEVGEAYINVQDGNDRFTGDQGEIRVACCHLECVEHGQGEATVGITELTDDEGRYIPSSTNPATVTCRPPDTPEYEGCFCIDPIELPVGTTGEACIYLENLLNGFSGCEAVITVPDDICGINEVVFNDALGLTNVDISQNGGRARIRVNDTANRLAGRLDRVRLCCLVIEARAEGTGTITAEIRQIDDDRGTPIPITVDPGTITCLPPQECPVVGSRPAATDPDADGLCEDVNGNGRMDFDDVSEFFAHMDDRAIQTNVDAFDFNANSRIDFDDIVELFKEI